MFNDWVHHLVLHFSLCFFVFNDSLFCVSVTISSTFVYPGCTISVESIQWIIYCVKWHVLKVKEQKKKTTKFILRMYIQHIEGKCVRPWWKKKKTWKKKPFWNENIQYYERGTMNMRSDLIKRLVSIPDEKKRHTLMIQIWANRQLHSLYYINNMILWPEDCNAWRLLSFIFLISILLNNFFFFAWNPLYMWLWLTIPNQTALLFGSPCSVCSDFGLLIFFLSFSPLFFYVCFCCQIVRSCLIFWYFTSIAPSFVRILNKTIMNFYRKTERAENTIKIQHTKDTK